MKSRLAILVAFAVVMVGTALVVVALVPDEGGAGDGFYPGAAQAPAAEGVTVTGFGRAKVERPALLSDRSIRSAVAAAQAQAYPRAAKNARARADVIARALGLELGRIDSASEVQDFYSAGVYGRFGPGRYCGTIARRTIARSAGGAPVVRRVRRHRCVVPHSSVTQLTLNFEIG